MVIGTTGIDITIIQNFLLIAISALACLYCAILSRRLKNLQNLKSGVGATIVELTDSVKSAREVSRENNRTMMEMITTLRHLTSNAEALISKLQARAIEVERLLKRSEKHKLDIEQFLEHDMQSAVSEAKKTSKTMLKMIKIISQYCETNENYRHLGNGISSTTTMPQSQPKMQTDTPKLKVVQKAQGL